MNPKFKAGDTVRCVKQAKNQRLIVGREYFVKATGDTTVQLDRMASINYLNDRFELVSRPGFTGVISSENSNNSSNNNMSENINNQTGSNISINVPSYKELQATKAKENKLLKATKKVFKNVKDALVGVNIIDVESETFKEFASEFLITNKSFGEALVQYELEKESYIEDQEKACEKTKKVASK